MSKCKPQYEWKTDLIQYDYIYDRHNFYINNGIRLITFIHSYTTIKSLRSLQTRFSWKMVFKPIVQKNIIDAALYVVSSSRETVLSRIKIRTGPYSWGSFGCRRNEFASKSRMCMRKIPPQTVNCNLGS